MNLIRFWLPALAFVILASLTYVKFSEKSRSLHEQISKLDSHLDTPLNLLDEGFNISERHEAKDSKFDIPKMKEGDLDAAFFAVFLSQKLRTEENTEASYVKAHRIIDSIEIMAKRYDNDLVLAYKASDLSNIKNENKRAIYIGMENGFPLGTKLNRVEEFYNRGVRYITLSHTLNNDICDSSTDEPEHNGLSSFGKDVVKEMNRLGMMIDVSHISDSAFYNVLSLSDAPVVASHSSVRSLCDHPRNLNDHMIKALAEKNGVVQICLLSDYIVAADTTTENYRLKEALRVKYNNYQFKTDEEKSQAWSAWHEIEMNYPTDKATVSQAVDHIDYVVNLVGIDYVGIGSDFDGGGGLADCRDISEFPNITAELVTRGYSKADIEKIWSGNFLRVFSSVESKATK